MRMQAASLVTILAVASAFVVQPECKRSFHCPCGKTSKNVTVCADEVSIENPCNKWTGCSKCQDWLYGCLECPEGFEGRSCSQGASAKITCEDPGFIDNSYRRNMNGRLSTSRRAFQDGELVIFSCKTEDFALQGSSFMMCKDGSWSNSLPRCIQSERTEEVSSYCRDPEVDPNGERKPAYFPRNRRGFRPGTRLEYYCNEGFNLEGEERIVCETRGQWSSPIPKCVAQTLVSDIPEAPSLPPMPQNTESLHTYSSEHHARNVSSYCRDPGVDSNGERNLAYPSQNPLGFRPGTRLEYSCNEGFSLKGEESIVCGTLGQWSSPIPKCVVQTHASAFIDSILAVASAIAAQPECKRSVHCPCGNTSKNVTVCADEVNIENPCSKWTGCSKCQDWMDGCLECQKGLGDHSCTQASADRRKSRQKRQYLYIGANPELQSTTTPQGACPDLERAHLGSLNCQTKHGIRICSGMCKKEYIFENLKKVTDLTCVGGVWTPQNRFPACIRASTKITCEDPGFIDNSYRRNMNGTLSNSPRTFQDGELVIFSCRTEYFALQGSSFMTCKDGSWSNPLPKCIQSERSEEVASYCRDPGVDPNGERNPAYPSQNRLGFNPGTHLEYFCNEGFSLEGEESIICEMTGGQWSSPIPICVAQTHASVSSKGVKCCYNPISVKNADVKIYFPLNLPRSCTRQSDEYELYPQETLLKYSCEEGFRLEGPSERYCMASEMWSSYPPSCKRDCGYSAVLASRRVTNGNKTRIGEWPWVVAISNKKNGIICGGVLLTNKVILTAAHCVTNVTRYTLYFGKLHLRDVDDDAKVGVRISNEIIIHPDYNATSYDSDIALVEFAPRIRFTDRVVPICLPTRETTAKNLKTGNIGYVTGWGVTERDLQAKELLLAELPFQSSSNCMASLGASLSPNMFCAGLEEGGQSACSGDSGSPLVYLNSDTSRYTLEGLVSFGIDGQCGLPKRYTTFTKVFNFLPWISRYI